MDVFGPLNRASGEPQKAVSITPMNLKVFGSDAGGASKVLDVSWEGQGVPRQALRVWMFEEKIEGTCNQLNLAFFIIHVVLHLF